MPSAKSRGGVVVTAAAGATSTDVSGFFNGALLAANAQTNFVAAEPGVTPTQLLPLEKCGPVHEATRHCYIELRSQSWAVLCLKLDGASSGAAFQRGLLLVAELKGSERGTLFSARCYSPRAGIAYHNFVLKISRPGDYTPAAGGDPAEAVQIPGLEPRSSRYRRSHARGSRLLTDRQTARHRNLGEFVA